MCLDCGCFEPENDHGDPAHITFADLAAAAAASGITAEQAAENILATVYSAASPVEKTVPDGPPQQFVLGVAYQAGPDPKIAKGVDGGRDYFTETELEKAAWSFMLSGQQHGLFHMKDTEGAARPVESYIYRNPVPWVVGPELVVRKGDWVLGAILDDKAWQLHKAGRINGWSPQGVARRRRRVR